MQARTLAHHNTRIANLKINFSEKSVPEIIRGYKTQSDKGKVNVTEEACRFYLYNELVSVISKNLGNHSDLGRLNDIVDDYMEMVAAMTSRLVYYMLLSIARESRHVLHDTNLGHYLISIPYKYEIELFINHMRGMDGLKAIETIIKYPVDVPIGIYLKEMERLFVGSNFDSGYGGDAWRKVITCLRRYVYGETTPVQFVDTGYTLAHNNGPIFNKKILYNHSPNSLLKVLDLQSMCSMINLVLLSDYNVQPFIDSADVDRVLAVAKEFGITPDENGVAFDSEYGINKIIFKGPSTPVTTDMEVKGITLEEDNEDSPPDDHMFKPQSTYEPDLFCEYLGLDKEYDSIKKKGYTLLVHQTHISVMRDTVDLRVSFPYGYIRHLMENKLYIPNKLAMRDKVGSLLNGVGDG